MVATSTIRRSVLDLVGVALVLLAMVAVYLPGMAPAYAGHGPFGTHWTLDGLPDPSPLVSVDDPCGNVVDDFPGDQPASKLKLNVIHTAPTPMIDTGSLGTGKADLCRVTLDTTVVGNDIFLYFSWTRFADSGSVVFGFELQHGDGDTPPCSDLTDIATCNPFSGRDGDSPADPTEDDFILLFDFTGSGADSGTITLGTRTFNGSSFEAFDSFTSVEGRAAVNNPTKPTSGEAVVNLTQAGILPSADDRSECVSFGYLVPFTLTGNSDTADFKDIILDNAFKDDINLSNCGTLTVVKSTGSVPDSTTEFPVTLTGTGVSDSTTLVGHGDEHTFVDLFAGNYTVDELIDSVTPAGGWSAAYDIVCKQGTTTVGDNVDGEAVTVPVSVNKDTRCTITNTPVLPTITLEKEIEDRWDGGATQADFTPTLGGTPRAWDTPIQVSPGTYTAGETSALLTSGAYAQQSIVCHETGDEESTVSHPVTVGLGDDVTCVITNVDRPATITLEKTVVNDDGGTAGEDAFTPSLDGDETTWDTPIEVASGAHVASESGALLASGEYTAGAWGGDCAANGSLTAANGQSYTCTITNDDVPATLTLVKTVDNRDGGTATADQFTPLIDGSTTVQGQTVTWTVPLTLDAGTYSASESSPLIDSGAYEAGDWTGDCAADGSVTLGLADDKTCYLTNDDVAPILIVDKVVINDDGGTLTESDFPLSITPAGGTAQAVEDEAETTVLANETYTVTETQQSGYVLTGIECSDGSSSETGSVDVSLQPGEVVTCTLTNDDAPATVRVRKNVNNDHGGTATRSDFIPYVDGVQTSWGTVVEIDAGEHIISESGDLLDSGAYVAGEWRGDCEPDGTLDAVNGGVYECIISNNDVPATVVVRKKVINDDGGTAGRSDFTPYVDGEAIEWGETIEIDAGGHVISESGDLLDSGAYVAGEWRGDCAPDGSLTAVNGGVYDCIITNDDVAPTLTLVKVVVNDDGGDAVEDDFQAMIDGDPVPWGVPQTLEANVEYAATESGPAGYDASLWTGDCSVFGLITLQPGEDAVCTITNDDIAPTLTVVKEVVNDDGGDAEAGDFPLFVNGEAVTSGVPTSRTANTEYTVSETQLDGYAQTDLSCVDDETEQEVPHPVTLDEGQSVTCTIVNDDLAPGLTVFKDVVNDDGGSATIADFPLFVGEVEVQHGVSTAVAANTPHTISETQLDGYALTGIVCTNGQSSDGSSIDVTLSEGEAVGCTLTNDDLPGTLVLTKTVVNDDGGSATADDFTPAVDGDDVTWSTAIELAAGSYTASESSSLLDTGSYVAGAWGGDCAADGSLTVENGGEYECTITNDDAPASIAVDKNADVEPDPEGLKVVDFDPTDDDEETVTYDYVVTNTGAVTLTDITLVDDVLGPITLATTTLAPGESTTGTAVHVLTQADSDAGTIVNVAVVTGTTPDDREVSDDDDEQVFLVEVLPSNPGIELVKSARIVPDEDGLKVVVYDRDAPSGNIVNYDYTITNTGDVTLTDITLVDDVLGAIVLPKTTLEPGESMTAVATHLVTGTDAAEGEIVNVAEVEGRAEGGGVKDTDDEQVFVVEVLAVTGVDADDLALVALPLLLLGVVLLLIGRRRPRPENG